MPELTAIAVCRQRRYGEVWMMILRFRLGEVCGWGDDRALLSGETFAELL